MRLQVGHPTCHRHAALIDQLNMQDGASLYLPGSPSSFCKLIKIGNACGEPPVPDDCPIESRLQVWELPDSSTESPGLGMEPYGDTLSG